MFIFLYIYSAVLYSLAPIAWIEKHNLIHQEQDFLSTIPCENHFYRDGLLYFLKSSSAQDFDHRVAKWCVRFDIPKEFDQRWTPLWFGKENILPFENIKARWKNDYDFTDPLNIFDEERTRDTEAISRYISSYSEAQKASPYPSYDACLHHFLKSSSIEDLRQRIETYCKQYSVPPSVRSTALLSQQDYDISPIIKDLHCKWQKILQDKIPPHIDNDRSRSIETLLMFGALSCYTFDSSSLKEYILRKMQTHDVSSSPPLDSLNDQTRDILKKAGFILDGHWHERNLYLMTSSQYKDLRKHSDDTVIPSLYSKGFFSILRQIAKRGPSKATPYDMREKFVSELEIYMVELFSGKEEAFLQEKSHNTLRFLNISSLTHYDVYLESVHHFYQK